MLFIVVVIVVTLGLFTRVSVVVMIVMGRSQPFFFGRMFGFLAQQGFAVGLRDLVIVRVDLGKGEETVPVSAVIHERRLKRRFDPCYLGKIDIALKLLMFGGFEVEFFNPIALDDRN